MDGGVGGGGRYTLHVGITGRDAAAANAPAGREALEQALVLDELGHAGLERGLALRLGFGALEEAAPEAVDLVLDALGVLDDLVGVAVAGLLLVGVGVVGAEVVGDLHEPHGCADEDVHVRYVGLHGWDGLDGGGSGADDGDAVFLPCFRLVFGGPAGGVDDLNGLELGYFDMGCSSGRDRAHLSLERFHAFNIRPLEIVEDASAVEENMASLVKEPCLPTFGLLELDQPLALLLLPVCAHHLCIKGHVLPESPDLAYLVQILPDIGAVAEEAWPVWIESERVCVGVGRDIAGGARVSIL